MEQKKYLVDSNNDWFIDDQEIRKLKDDLSAFSIEERKQFVDNLTQNEELKSATQEAFESRLMQIKLQLMEWEDISNEDFTVLQSYAVLFLGKSMEEVGMQDGVVTAEMHDVFLDILKGLEGAKEEVSYDEFKEELFGENVDLDDSILDLNPETRDSYNQFSTLVLIADVFDVWKEKAYSVEGELWFKYLRDDDEVIKEQIGDIEYEIANAQRGFSSDLTFSNDYVERIFEKIRLVEEQENVIGMDDMSQIQEILLDGDLSMEDKKLKCLSLMRDGWIDGGNSTKVADVLLEDVVYSKWFDIVRDINKEENIEKIWEILDSGAGIEQLEQMWIPKEIAEDFVDKYEEFLAHNKEQKDEIKDKILELNPGLEQNPVLLDKQVNIVIEQWTRASAFLFLEHAMASYVIEKRIWRENEIKLWTCMQISSEFEHLIWLILQRLLLCL